MCSVISCTWISKVRDLRLSNLTAADPPRGDDIRARPPLWAHPTPGREPRTPGPSAERLDDATAAEQLVAAVHDRALPGRDAALRRPELDPDLIAERLD